MSHMFNSNNLQRCQEILDTIVPGALVRVQAQFGEHEHVYPAIGMFLGWASLDKWTGTSATNPYVLYEKENVWAIEIVVMISGSLIRSRLDWIELVEEEEN